MAHIRETLYNSLVWQLCVSVQISKVLVTKLLCHDSVNASCLVWWHLHWIVRFTKCSTFFISCNKITTENLWNFTPWSQPVSYGYRQLDWPTSE